MVTMTTADNALKSFYLDAVTEALNMKVNPLLAKMEKTSKDVYGKDVRKAVRIGMNGGIGAGTETGDLPGASSGEYTQMVSTLKNLYGTIEISDKALKASSSDEGAFVNLLNEEMNSLVKSSAYNFSRMLFGKQSGVLAEYIGSSAPNCCNVDTAKNFVVGMVVDVYNGSGKKVISGARIIDIDKQDGTIVFDRDYITEGIDVTDGFITLQGSYQNELCGLEEIFGDSETLYGLNRESHFFLQPYKAQDVGQISEGIIQKAIDSIEENSGSKVNYIVCSWGVKRALVQYYANMQMKMDTITLEDGTVALSFNGIPVVTDRFCPNGTMYLLNTDDFKLHQLCDWQWLEGDGGKILQKNPTKPVYSATLVKYAEILCERPFGQGKISGITEV